MRNTVKRTLLGEQNDIKFFGINGPERLQLEAQKQKIAANRVDYIFYN